MANVVQIVITVDNAQANAALATTGNALKQAGITAQTSSQQLSGAAARGGESLQQLGRHSATSLDAVRLLSQEFGLRLPRALEAMIARSSAASSALQSLVGGAALFAVGEVIYRTGDAVYNLYEKYISLNAAAEEYNKTVQQHKDEDFVNTRSIEDTTLRLHEATDAAKGFKQLGEEIHNGAWADILSFDPTRVAMGIGAMVGARKATDEGYKSQEASHAAYGNRAESAVQTCRAANAGGACHRRIAAGSAADQCRAREAPRNERAQPAA